MSCHCIHFKKIKKYHLPPTYSPYKDITTASRMVAPFQGIPPVITTEVCGGDFGPS